MTNFKKTVLGPLLFCSMAAALLISTPVAAGEVSDYPTYRPAEQVVDGVRIPRPKGNEHLRHVGPPFALWAYLRGVEEAEMGQGETGPSYVDDAPEGAPVPLPKPRKRILDGAS